MHWRRIIAVCVTAAVTGQAGVAMGPSVVHDPIVTVGPAGDGVGSPPIEAFATATQHTPSMLAFNRSRPPAAYRDVSP